VTSDALRSRVRTYERRAECQVTSELV
jgi:hypothetical protein